MVNTLNGSMVNEDYRSMISIPLTHGFTAIVDDVDADLTEFKWHSSTKNPNNSYATRQIYPSGQQSRIRFWLHKVILGRMIGRTLSDDELGDHIDGNTFNCTRSNLRLANHSGNSFNRKKTSRNTSGFKGVCLYKRTGKWVATIRVNRKQIWLGQFETAEMAHEVYKQASVKYHGEFGRTE